MSSSARGPSARETTCEEPSDEAQRDPGAAVRPGTLRLGLLVLGMGLLAGSLSACESTQDESARIGREGSHRTSAPTSLKLGAANREVRVSDTTVLSSGGRSAVAAKLTSTAASSQADIPLLLTVTGTTGKSVYSNQAGGLEASLQRMALLRAHQSGWWVDDQVLTSQTAKAATVRVGTGRRVVGASVALRTRGVSTSEQGGISVVSGTVVNGSSTSQSKVPVFAVAQRGGKVIAAGRAVVPELPGRVGASASFQVFLVGNPAGAPIELTAVPTGVR